MPLHDLEKKDGYKKLHFVSDMAERCGMEHVWVNTCCIDKKSSAELSEAINSMYRYYELAEICWVLLSDMPPECPHLLDGDGLIRWFTRGWTLQELLAPKLLEFYGPGHHFFRHRSDLMDDIREATNIDPLVLQGNRPLHSISIAKRMSWAAKRSTTRPEDRAYSLLGIFDANMPMFYGEGNKAFEGLQETIMRSSDDHSIFAWDLPGKERNGRLLAPSPAYFLDSHKIVGSPSATKPTRLAQGWLEITLKVREYEGYVRGIPVGHRLAILDCGYEDDLDCILGVWLVGRFSGIVQSDARVACSSSTQKVPLFEVKATRDIKD